jgi:hypothetical protein
MKYLEAYGRFQKAELGLEIATCGCVQIAVMLGEAVEKLSKGLDESHERHARPRRLADLHGRHSIFTRAPSSSGEDGTGEGAIAMDLTAKRPEGDGNSE